MLTMSIIRAPEEVKGDPEPDQCSQPGFQVPKKVSIHVQPRGLELKTALLQLPGALTPHVRGSRVMGPHGLPGCPVHADSIPGRPRHVGRPHYTWKDGAMQDLSAPGPRLQLAGPPPRLAEAGAGLGVMEGGYQPVLVLSVLIDTSF